MRRPNFVRRSLGDFGTKLYDAVPLVHGASRSCVRQNRLQEQRYLGREATGLQVWQR
jgi:hypothetical protein